ncbi:MAG: hydrogenase formation protein HypD [Selenomonadaceae bacterium]|nr:hydrogenase formation protein HypD [Selenomonadaceae bacterium]
MEINGLKEKIENYDGRKIRIMEVCGTHTHEIFRLGVRSLLPKNIELISGPGCPVCVTPVSFIDEAVYLAKTGKTIFTFGDLVRVPGSDKTLANARQAGAKVEIVYSPLDALQYAKNHPEEEIVFLSVGFETTTPASLLALKQAIAKSVKNFSLLTANKTMDEAYRVMAKSADAYLYPGHVAAITGAKKLEELKKIGISGVVTGFTAKEILQAICFIIENAQKGEPFFGNAYENVVKPEGNKAATELVEKFTRPIDTEWRGLGILKKSGLTLKDEFTDFDARKKFSIPKMNGTANPACKCGDVLSGKIFPKDCPLFAKVCVPEHPIGACMVSNEGACSAFYKYGI